MRTLLEEDAAKHERRRQEARLRALAHPKSKRLLKAANALANQTRFIQEYVGLCEKIVKVTKLSQRQTVDDLLPNFGMTGKDLVDLMRKQLNSYTYREGRRFQLFHAVGIKSQKFINELNGLEFDFDKKKVEYSTAGEDDKAKIHEVYVTKDLVETRLNEKTGWWKFWHPGQTKAMEAYLDKANKLLDTVQFPKTVPDAAKAFANQGYAFADPKSKAELEAEFARVADEVNQKLADSRNAREAKSAEKRAKLDEQRKQEMERQAKLDKQAAEKQKNLDEKLAQIQTEVDAVRGKDLKDQLLEVRFRPSLNADELNKLYQLMRDEFSPLLHGDLPKGVKTVVQMNWNKIKWARDHVKNIGGLTAAEIQNKESFLQQKIMKAEEDVLKTEQLQGYKPITFTELETIKLQQQLQADTGAKENAPKEVAPKHDEPVVQKEMSQKEIN
jgi:hypothetical protein